MLVDFGHSFCFSRKVRCPTVDHLIHYILFPLIFFHYIFFSASACICGGSQKLEQRLTWLDEHSAQLHRGLYKLVLSRADKGDWEWVCYLGGQSGAPVGWLKRLWPCQWTKMKRPTEWLIKFLIYRKLYMIWHNEWLVHGRFHLAVLSKKHNSNGFENFKHHKVSNVSMVKRGKIVRLSYLCKINWADPRFRFCFQLFRSLDLNKITEKPLNALTLKLSYMWAWSFFWVFSADWCTVMFVKKSELSQ